MTEAKYLQKLKNVDSLTWQIIIAIIIVPSLTLLTPLSWEQRIKDFKTAWIFIGIGLILCFLLALGITAILVDGNGK